LVGRGQPALGPWRGQAQRMRRPRGREATGSRTFPKPRHQGPGLRAPGHDKSPKQAQRTRIRNGSEDRTNGGKQGGAKNPFAPGPFRTGPRRKKNKNHKNFRRPHFFRPHQSGFAHPGGGVPPPPHRRPPFPRGHTDSPSIRGSRLGCDPKPKLVGQKKNCENNPGGPRGRNLPRASPGK